VPPAVRLWAGFARDARRLAKIFRRNPVDLLHTHNVGFEESPVAARLAGVPRVVGTFHVDPTYDLHRAHDGARHRLLEMLSNRCLDRAVAVSRDTKHAWVSRTHLPAERVVTIPNGIDPDQFRRRTGRAEARRELGLPERALMVGGVGRLDWAKGFEYLLKAVASLAGAYPDLHLALAGEGPLRPDLEQAAAELGITHRVHFLGFHRDVQPVYDALDVFALPSLCETQGYAHLEAMATELPAVGTTVGGVPEVIVHDETGFLARPRDPVSLAAALRPLLDSPDLRHRFGRAGRERVERRFHERDMVRRTIGLYRGLLGR
jgi:glycosyltransferase involved in cell wall biosynthesis